MPDRLLPDRIVAPPALAVPASVPERAAAVPVAEGAPDSGIEEIEAPKRTEWPVSAVMSEASAMAVTPPASVVAVASQAGERVDASPESPPALSPLPLATVSTDGAAVEGRVSEERIDLPSIPAIEIAVQPSPPGPSDVRIQSPDPAAASVEQAVAPPAPLKSPSGIAAGGDRFSPPLPIRRPAWIGEASLQQQREAATARQDVERQQAEARSRQSQAAARPVAVKAEPAAPTKPYVRVNTFEELGRDSP